MPLTDVRRKLEPLLRRGFHLYWRFSRGMTMGVRALVIDRERRIFLVRHSYVRGWHLPGGGVEPGETLREALARELVEEGNIELTGEPRLYGMYFNAGASQRDHVALFVVEEFRQPSPPQSNREIVAHGFFPRDGLPEETTRGTRARIDEVLGGAPVSARW